MSCHLSALLVLLNSIYSSVRLFEQSEYDSLVRLFDRKFRKSVLYLNDLLGNSDFGLARSF